MTKTQNENLYEAIAALSDNSRFVRSGYWKTILPSERRRILTEVRHDLEDALKSVKALEDAR